MPNREVTTLADDGTGYSLRQAIIDATDGDTITFQAGLTGTITLTSALPILQHSVTIEGDDRITVDGHNLYRIFFAGDGAAITVALQHLTLQNGYAKGGNGSGGGGGGMGAGGALFVNKNVTATLDHVQFNGNRAIGGNGGNGGGGHGGGGGLGGDGGSGGPGGSGGNGGGGGGGYFGAGGNGLDGGGGGGGGRTGSGANGSATSGGGGNSGGGNGGNIQTNGGTGAAFGGGGGGGGWGTGVMSGSGGNGGDFGGGGGGGNNGDGRAGGFGGGGGAGYLHGGVGGFGGGGGATVAGSPASGGPGGGNSQSSIGGGGAGFGGAVFLRDGASLTVIDSGFSGGTVSGGTGIAGMARGSAMFLGADVTYQVAGSINLADTIGGLAGSADADGKLIKTGIGTLILSGANTYVGATKISAGTLEVRNGSALSDTTTTTIESGATLAVTNSETVGNIEGAGDISLAASQTLTAGNGTDTALSGNIVDSGRLAKTGTGKLTLSGTNTYSGGTTISGGTLTVGNEAQLGSGAVQINNGSVLQTTASTTLDATVTLGTGGGVVDTGDSFLLNGVVSGTSLEKRGTGTLTLAGSNNYTGTTVVNGGKLVVDGTIASSASTVINSGGTLGGHGTVGALQVQSGGLLAPGNSPGILHTGDLSLDGGATTQIELNGTTVGTDYDQIAVTGTVSLGGSNLSLSSGFTATAGQTFTIIDNDGSDAVTGTFNGLAEGATVSVGGKDYKISYAGGDGNDVVLTVPANIAPPADPSATPTGTFVRTQAQASGGVLSGTYGNDQFLGADGRDTVLLQGVQLANATIVRQADGSIVITTTLGADTLRNVEQVAFADGTLQLDLGGTRALNVEALYHGAFGRAPDAAGLHVQLDSALDVGTLARNFAASPEFVTRWNGLTDTDFVTALYRNVLNRAPDSGGQAVQLDALAHGLSRATLLANFATAAESVQLLAQLHPVGIFTNDILV